LKQAPTKELFAIPESVHQGLLRSVPDPTAEQGDLYQIPGLAAGRSAPACRLSLRTAFAIAFRKFVIVSSTVRPVKRRTIARCANFAHEVYEESRAEAKR